jgi:hypothetical protein
MTVSLLLSDTPTKLNSTMHATCFRQFRPSSGINVHNFKKSSFKLRPQVKPLGSKQRGVFRSVVLIRISLHWKKSL